MKLNKKIEINLLIFFVLSFIGSSLSCVSTIERCFPRKEILHAGDKAPKELEKYSSVKVDGYLNYRDYFRVSGYTNATVEIRIKDGIIERIIIDDSTFLDNGYDIQGGFVPKLETVRNIKKGGD